MRSFLYEYDDHKDHFRNLKWLVTGISSNVIPSAALDLYCTAGISVYAPRENDVLVLPHIRR